MNLSAAEAQSSAPWHARLPVAIAVVAVIYVALALLNNDGGYLGSDTGAKVATLDRMVERGSAVPGVGYWAEPWDPAGDYHPMFDTMRNDAGEWVHVTTLPMLEAARPLYSVGGYRLTLLLPILGALLCAVAARDIARRLADHDDADAAGMRAFWVIALASPIAVYALDFWEHAPGAGLMVLGVAILLRFVDGGKPIRHGVLAGAAFGVAATMRTETFVVAFVAVAVAGLTVVRRRTVASVTLGVAAVGGFALPWLANSALESSLGGHSRSERAGRELGRGPLSKLAERAEEAVITWFGLPYGASWQIGAFVGLVVVLCVVGIVVSHRRGEPRIARILAAAAAIVYLLVAADGLGFIPGALVASPVAACAALLERLDRRRAFILLTAVFATPLIWAFQITGGAGPQWGGRYLLATTVLLTTLGAVALGSSSEVARRQVFALAALTTALGLGWLLVRSHGADNTFDELAERDEDVIISTNGFFLREGGPVLLDEAWLSIGRRGTLDGAVEVARDSGARSIGVLDQSVEPPDLAATFVETDIIDFLGIDLRYHVYRLDEAG